MDPSDLLAHPAGRVVLVAMDQGELLAMCALMLETAGFRVFPVAGLDRVEARARDLRPYAVVADIRRGGAGDWDTIRRLRADPLTGGRLVLMIDGGEGDGSEALPPEMADQPGAAILRWPFPVTDILHSLLPP
jgi:CheY-like chemotaxis protein